MIFCFAILKCKVVFQQQQVSQAVSLQRNKNLKKSWSLNFIHLTKTIIETNKLFDELLFPNVRNKI